MSGFLTLVIADGAIFIEFPTFIGDDLIEIVNDINTVSLSHR